jgi:putative nucleotidyltransferase with HDIG domain
MAKKLTRRQAWSLLQKYDVPQGVLIHTLQVEKTALKIARQLENHRVKIDKVFLRTAAILHDIGRYKISLEKGYPKEELGLHAPEGQILLEKLGYSDLAKIAGGHFLTEVTKDEAKKLGWPISVKLPDRIEAKIISVADLMRGNENAEKEIEKIFSREDLGQRYWEKIPGFKEKTRQKMLANLAELKRLGWDGLN